MNGTSFFMSVLIVILGLAAAGVQRIHQVLFDLHRHIEIPVAVEGLHGHILQVVDVFGHGKRVARLACPWRQGCKTEGKGLMLGLRPVTTWISLPARQDSFI